MKMARDLNALIFMSNIIDNCSRHLLSPFLPSFSPLLSSLSPITSLSTVCSQTESILNRQVASCHLPNLISSLLYLTKFVLVLEHVLYLRFDRQAVESYTEYEHSDPSERSHYDGHWDQMMAKPSDHPKKKLVERAVLLDFQLGSSSNQHLMFLRREKRKLRIMASEREREREKGGMVIHCIQSIVFVLS